MAGPDFPESIRKELDESGALKHNQGWLVGEKG